MMSCWAYLGVNDQWPSLTSGDEDAVLQGKSACWQALQIPLPHRSRICQKAGQVEDG